MFYLNTIEQMFKFVELKGQLEVCLPCIRRLTRVPMLAVFQTLWWSNIKMTQFHLPCNGSLSHHETSLFIFVENQAFSPFSFSVLGNIILGFQVISTLIFSIIGLLALSILCLTVSHTSYHNITYFTVLQYPTLVLATLTNHIKIS